MVIPMDICVENNDDGTHSVKVVSKKTLFVELTQAPLNFSKS